MSDLLPFVIIGLVNGTIYSIGAMGLTLTFKTTGVFNFAYGAIAAASAYFFYDLHDLHGLAWPLASLITLALFGIVVGLLFERFGKVLARVPPPMQIAATVGVMVAVQALIVIRYGSVTVNFANFLPTNAWQLGGVYVTATQVIVLGATIALAVGLWVLLRFTSFGLTTRGVVDAPELLSLTGRNPGIARRGSWMLGSAFAAVSGVLTAVVVGTLDPTILTLLLVQAFGAAAIGYFSNLGLSFVGGLFLGILAALTTYWVQGDTALSGLPNAIPFLALLIMLLVTPRGRLVVQRAAHFTPAAVKAASSGRWLIVKTLAGVAVVLVAPEVLGESRLPSLTEALVLTILFLSLGVLVHLSGQVSLIQYSLAAVGAVAFSDFAGVHGMPWLLALLFAGLVATPVGAIVAIPAIRVSGLFLALATFGFGLVLQQLFYPLPLMFGDRFGIPTPRPSWAQGQLAYYYVVAGVVALAALLVIFVTRSRLGRLLRGLAGSPVAIATNGASLEVTKVLIFCISAFLAGISGALVGPITGSVTSTPFDPLNSLTLLTVLILAGGGMVRYAFVGGIALALIPSYITNSLINSYLQVLFGVSAVVIAIMAARTAHRRPPPAVLTRVITPVRRLLAGAAPALPASSLATAGAAAADAATRADREEVTP